MSGSSTDGPTQMDVGLEHYNARSEISNRSNHSQNKFRTPETPRSHSICTVHRTRHTAAASLANRDNRAMAYVRGLGL